MMVRESGGGWRSAGVGVLWAVLGGVAAYLLDPRSGHRRRALARERLTAMARRAARLAPRKIAYAGGRLRGAVHAVAPGRASLAPPDQSAFLAHKVSTELGRLPDPPRERLNVDAVDGVVHLRGRLTTSDQVTRVIAWARQVEGVRDVVSHVTTRE
ncbi:MAG: hypothetical protein NVSMB65_11480 [Chloroflexota bacterium]